MKQLLTFFVVAAVVAGCSLFSGTPSATLEMQTPPAGGPIDVQILDSAVEPGEVYLKLAIHNRSDRPLVVDRRALVLSDGRAQWRVDAGKRPFVTIKPNASSSKIKLTYAEVMAGQPAYDLVFDKGAFHQDSETGAEVTLQPVRLLVKKTANAVPEPEARDDAESR